MALGNYGTQKGGEGEAVILNPQGFYNNVLAQDRYKRQLGAVNDRIAAKQKADQDKAAKEELYKMSSQTAGPAKYLTPYVTAEREKLNQEILNDVSQGKFVNDNVYRLRLNAIQNLERQGLSAGEDIDKRLADLQKDQFIKGSPFMDAYRANLDEDVKRHLAEGKPLSTYTVDNNALIKKASMDPRFEVYDLDAIGKNIKINYPDRTIEQPRVPGKTTGITKASPFYKIDPNTGLATKEIDFDMVARAFNNPAYKDPINQRFARELTIADSPYFIENSKLKQKFANDPEGYADAQEALKSDFIKNKLAIDATLTSDALQRSPSSVVTARLSGGRGKQPPKVVIGNAAPLVIKSYTKPSKQGELSEELLSIPIIGSDAAEKQAPLLEEAKSTPTINIGADQVIRKQPIPPESEFDLANPQYTTLPVLKADIKVSFRNKAGDVVKTKTFKKGTVIGQGDEFSGENKAMITQVAKEANRGNNIEYKFGALIPTYSRQTKKLSFRDAAEEAARTGVPVEEVQANFESKKLGTYQGLNFIPRDMSPSSLFQRAWSAGKNRYRGMTLRQIENNSTKDARGLFEVEADIKPKSSLDFFKKAPSQNTNVNKGNVKMQGY